MNYVKLAIYAAAIAFAVWLGHFIYDAGANSVQTKWNASIAAQSNKAVTADNDALKAQIQQAAQYVTVDSIYQKGVTDAESISSPVPAGLSAGTISLRPEWSCQGAGSGALPKSAASPSGPDLAAAAAATQRLADSVTLVQVGYAADKREAELDAGWVARNAIIAADRQQGAKQ